MENLLNELNDSQRDAVVYCDGAQLVIAGAGSGKTRVLTYKIAYLLQQYYLAPWNILALTFTNKAAREMKERIARLVGEERARYLQMGTFHSIFARILRNEAQTIGYQSNFTIYDQSDARSLVKNIIHEMQLDDKVYKPNTVADQISMAKNHLILPDAFGNCSLFDPKHPQVASIYRMYAMRCRQANAMDFDDLLVQTFLLFNEHEDIRQKYVEKFQYVLVDEYQDTNYAQQRIVYQLTRERQRVCVVGDDAQSIYSFRGANIDNILNFREAYTNARLFKLEQNYRSTQLIVEAANSLIRKNERQIPKDVYSRNEHGEKLQLKPAQSDREEAMIVCNDIKRLRRSDHLQWNDFAILYRTNAQSRSFEEQMRKDNIPYRIYGGLSFYQRKEIKDVIAYFRTVTNPDDEEALRRIINYPTRGIGDTTVQKIIGTATQHGVSLWTVISQPVLFRLDVTKGTATKLEAFRQLIEGWRTRLASEDAYQLGHAIIQESGIAKDIYSSRNPEDLSRQENLQEFLAGMQDFVESRREEDMGNEIALTDFLQEVALLTDLDSDKDSDQPKVSLMTIHSAKGLEFPVVFIVGLEENIFPSPMCTNSMRELEEERRLLYVAITRAEKHCILTCAENRFRFGRMEFDTPSRFIRDIDPQLLHVDGNNHFAPFPARERPGVGLQNAHPVATQFKADPMRRAVPRSKPEPAVDPLSPQFKQLLHTASGGRFKPLSSLRNTSSAASSSPRANANVTTPLPTREGQGESLLLREGTVIEHQRFGIGTVVRLEGTGDNEKATVDFRNAGTKQLLLKFARYKIVKP
ncbi:MAG: UvrD-helicase domain-containing protein [Prevotella sp.]|nr:UvrD-helicase domain-containing protein [Prevotella sp.]